MKHSILSQRRLKMGELVRRVIANFLQRESIYDHALEKIIFSVSEVRMSSDLKIATCFIIPLGNTRSEEIITALTRHTKYIRGRIGKDLRQTKYVPELHFYLDTGFDNFTKINSLLRSDPVMKDLRTVQKDLLQGNHDKTT